MQTFYLLYARKTNHHKWNIYGAALTLERIQILARGLRQDTPPTWQICITETQSLYPTMDAWDNLRTPTGKVLEVIP